MYEQEQNKKAILLFDGICTLCNKTVDFVVRRDPKRHFQFASLQSKAAKQLLREHGIEPKEGTQETIYLIEGKNVYTKSTAALRAARKLRFPWPALYIAVIVPRMIRDFVYDFIGARRLRWFGTTNTCDAREKEAEQDRFLDDVHSLNRKGGEGQYD